MKKDLSKENFNKSKFKILWTTGPRKGDIGLKVLSMEGLAETWVSNLISFNRNPQLYITWIMNNYPMNNEENQLQIKWS